jgi:hypothetical protein
LIKFGQDANTIVFRNGQRWKETGASVVFGGRRQKEKAVSNISHIQDERRAAEFRSEPLFGISYFYLLVLIFSVSYLTMLSV